MCLCGVTHSTSQSRSASLPDRAGSALSVPGSRQAKRLLKVHKSGFRCHFPGVESHLWPSCILAWIDYWCSGPSSCLLPLQWTGLRTRSSTWWSSTARRHSWHSSSGGAAGRDFGRRTLQTRPLTSHNGTLGSLLLSGFRVSRHHPFTGFTFSGGNREILLKIRRFGLNLSSGSAQMSLWVRIYNPLDLTYQGIL